VDCKTCSVQEFVHKDIYCQGCPSKPKPKIVKGRAYLYKRNSSEPVCSVDIEAPKGSGIEVAAVELMKQLRIEFVPD
jgi:hypothetical protein